jgi:hypothetical protein
VKQILSAFSLRDESQVYPSAQAETQSPSSGSDLDLEDRINLQARLLREDRSPEENRATWLELTRLHAMRSPARVAEMEAKIR